MKIYLVTYVRTGENLRLQAENEQEAYYRAIDFWNIHWENASNELTIEEYKGNWLAEHLFPMLWMLVVAVMLSCLLIIVLLGPEGLRRVLGF